MGSLLLKKVCRQLTQGILLLVTQCIRFSLTLLTQGIILSSFVSRRHTFIIEFAKYAYGKRSILIVRSLTPIVLVLLSCQRKSDVARLILINKLILVSTVLHQRNSND